MSDSIPTFENTLVGDIAPAIEGLRAKFRSQATRPIEWRLTQLRKLYWALVDNEGLIIEANKRDTSRPEGETILAEIELVKNDLLLMCRNLEKWAKEEPISDAPLFLKLARPRIRKDPVGTVLIISAYNFNVQLSIMPLTGAIAAGCTAVVKPSEQAPATAAVIQKIITEALDGDCFKVVQGGVPETTALLDQHFDKIFYTGGVRVAKIIAAKAARNLTPLTLELGGRNPAFVTRNADIKLAARRILWTKSINAGQVCLSANYILVEKSVMADLVREIKAAWAEWYPDGAQASDSYGRIATDRSWQRLRDLLGATGGKILLGGGTDEATRFVEPTIVQVTDPSDPLVAEETFGPIVSLFPVDDLDKALEIANSVDPTPLAAYPFGTTAETEAVLQAVRSGGASVNDGIFHASIPGAPFGGFGESGQGSYHGKASFDCFSHHRTVTTTPGWMETLLRVRYPPYTTAKINRIVSSSGEKPNFGRDGKLKHSLTDYILSGRSARLVVAVAIAFGIKEYLARRGSI